MYCKNCGNLLSDDAKFCSRCGQAQEPAKAAEPIYQQQTEPQYTYEQPAQTPYKETEEAKKKRSSLASSALTWGILSLAFAVSGCIGLLGFIFSFIAKKKVNEYIRLYGAPETRVSVGKGLAKAGFIVGLVMMIFWTVYCFILFFAMFMSLMLI